MILEKILLIKQSRVQKSRSAIKLADEHILETEQQLMKLSTRQDMHIKDWKNYSSQCIGEVDNMKLQKVRSKLRHYFEVSVSIEREKVEVGSQLEKNKLAKYEAQQRLTRCIKEEEKLNYIIEKGMN